MVLRINLGAVAYWLTGRQHPAGRLPYAHTLKLDVVALTYHKKEFFFKQKHLNKPYWLQKKGKVEDL